MRSHLVDLLRFGGDPGILRKGDRYLATATGEPVHEIAMPLEHWEFLELQKKLRYTVEEVARNNALGALTEYVTAFLKPALEHALASPGEGFQVDLVLHGDELSALPFEAMRLEAAPVFARARPAIILTRRVRREFSLYNSPWPARPRVLLVIASPGDAGPPVPAEENKTALRAALKPWIEPLEGFPQAVPDERAVLTTLKGATLEDLRRVCKESDDAKRPYTHVHILAHGVGIGDFPHQHFGLALHHPSGQGSLPASPEDLIAALGPLIGKCVAVTLAACDGGNQSNTITPQKSIAHELHVAGFPIVLASQLPLTFPGSALMTERFYTSLIAGEDAREAVHAARVALYGTTQTSGHDWASVVAYIQLPEGYADYLGDVQAAVHLGSLETAQCWSDHLLFQKVTSIEAFERVATMVDERIQALHTALQRLDSAKRLATYQEHCGLLASAYKRLAELYYRWGSLSGGSIPLSEKMKEALRNSRDRYLQAARVNLAHHWTAVQYLSLCAVLDGALPKVWLWDASLEAAEVSVADGRDYWGFGSIVELQLLAPYANHPRQIDKACAAAVEVVRRANSAGKKDPIVSLKRQLRRYASWWTKENGFFGGGNDLAADAATVLTAVEAVESQPARFTTS